jgi:hypothetical protein
VKVKTLCCIRRREDFAEAKSLLALSKMQGFVYRLFQQFLGFLGRCIVTPLAHTVGVYRFPLTLVRVSMGHSSAQAGHIQRPPRRGVARLRFLRPISRLIAGSPAPVKWPVRPLGSRSNCPRVWSLTVCGRMASLSLVEGFLTSVLQLFSPHNGLQTEKSRGIMMPLFFCEAVFVALAVWNRAHQPGLNLDRASFALAP